MKKIFFITLLIASLNVYSKDIRCKIIDAGDNSFVGVIAFQLNEKKKIFTLIGTSGETQILRNDKFGLVYHLLNKNFKYDQQGNLISVNLIEKEGGFPTTWQVALDLNSAVIQMNEKTGWGSYVGKCESMANKL